MPAPQEGPTDEQLADRIRRGDRAAFKALFQNYYEALCGFVESRVGDPNISEDLVQNIFLNLWRRHEKLDPQGNVKAYLFGAARNESVDYRNRRSVRDDWKAEKKEESRPDLDHVPGPRHQISGPGENVEHQQLKRELRKSISELPERRRQVYVLSRRHGLTYKEIAVVMNISPKTVDNQMVEALKFLRERLCDFAPTAER